MRYNVLKSLIPVFLALACSQCVTRAAVYTFRHENVLGTSLELQIDVDSATAAQQIEQLTLQQIDRLDRILSRYDRNSELMRWQRGALTGHEVSSDLKAVLNAAESWREITGGAFDVRAGALSQMWKTAQETGELPDDSARVELLHKLSQPAVIHDADGGVTPNRNLPLSLDGLAKGYILDSVCEHVRDTCRRLRSFVINIGGDIRRTGQGNLLVSVTNPADSSVGASPLLSFPVTESMGVATSGGYRRYFTIQGRRFSHIIDPRTGFPQNQIQSATVLAPSAIDADAAATAVCVLSVEEGLALVENQDGMECALLGADGRLLVSSGWPAASGAEHRRTAGTTPASRPQRGYLLTSVDKPGLRVDFTLARPKKGRYRRPYVAVWLEDQDGFPVKTAVLWIQTEQPGPRWHRDLTRWFRHDRMRMVVEKEKLIGTVSSATRGPGEYTAHFDGTDNNGEPLPPGQYTLCLEAAREHGSYQMIRRTLELGAQPIAEQELPGNVEIGKASCVYVPWQAGDKAEQ